MRSIINKSNVNMKKVLFRYTAQWQSFGILMTIFIPVLLSGFICI